MARIFMIKKTGILFFLFIFAYFPTLQWMWERWFERDSYYSHDILIPFITIYLIWQKRDVLKNLKLEASPWGLRLFITGIIIHMLSLLFRIYFTSGFSMIKIGRASCRERV